MAGFIQLICAGTEQSFLNKNATINFFSIIYRRYSNFFINTIVEHSNDIDNKENTVTSLIVQNSGDLLSESYLRFESQENHIELFDNSPTNNTIKTNILNLYDNYSIKTDEFNKNMIQQINVIKIILNNFLTIQSNNLINMENQKLYTQLIITNSTLQLEEDDEKIFYNLNNLYYYYSFYTIDIQPQNIKNELYLEILFNSIDYNTIEFIRIDFSFYNFSFKIIDTPTNYKKIIDLFLNNQNINDKNRFKITEYSLYLYTNNTNLSTILFNEINNNIQNDFNFIYYTEKIKNTNTLINKTEIEKILLENNNNEYKYYIINFTKNNITSYNFDNFDNNDFNESLINNETSLINNFNLNTKTNTSSITLLRLLVFLFNNKTINLENYLNTLNSNINNNTTNLNYLNKKYLNNNDFFDKIINILFQNNTLIASSDFYSSLLYQLKTQNEYFINFLNKKINNYTTTIINIFNLQNEIYKYYASSNTVNNISNKLINSIFLFNSSKVILNKTILINLLINNNYNNYIFEINSTTDTIYYTNLIDNFKEFTTKQITYYYQYSLSFFKLTSKSINLIKNIYNQKSNHIYQTTGINTLNVFKFPFSIFPLTSSLYINSTKNNVFNKELKNFINEINTLIYEDYIKNNFNKSKIIFNKYITKNEFVNINNYVINELTLFIKEYYSKRENIQNLLNLSEMEEYTNDLNLNNCFDIYKKNYNEIILFGIFNKINNELFNGCFENINIYKFYFSIGSPLYRLFYLFNFLCVMTENKELINIMPFDLNTLRNLTLYYLLSYLEINNNKNILLETFYFNNNFLCYDNITTLNYINNDGINIYSPFYFIKTGNDTNNFDSNLIENYKLYILNNRNDFVNVENIILFVDKYFDKKINNFVDVIEKINLIIKEPNQYIDINDVYYNPEYFYNNKIYNNNYQTVYSVGILFDNVNIINISTIVFIYNQIKNSNSKIDDIYTIVNYNIKKNTNFIENNNITNVFNYVLSLMYKLNQSSTVDILNNYNMLIEGYEKYLKNNVVYLDNYLINKIVFINAYNTIIEYFRIVSNSILLDRISKINFEMPLFKIILIYVVEFLKINLSSDINIFLNNVDNYVDFNDYLINKYNKNIYENLIKNLIFNFTKANDYNNLNFSVFDLNNNFGIVDFYVLFNNTIFDITNQYDKFIYSTTNEKNVNTNSIIDVVNDKLTVTESYLKIFNETYFISISTLNDIYVDLKNNYLSKRFNYNTNEIIKNLLFIINNFSINNNNNYFKTLYYKPSQNNNLLNSYVVLFFNDMIQNSLNVETEINRFLYYHITKNISINLDELNKEYLKNNSLYTIVKMYKNIENNYIDNLYITQNIIAYELLNLNLFNDTLSPMQNSLFVELITTYNMFYEDYVLFYEKCLEFDFNIFNPLILDFNINVGEFFLNIENKKEFENYINNYILSTEDFSPFNIYNQIIELRNNLNEIDCKYDINKENIMKKIVIYLFMLFFVYDKLPYLIIKYLDLRLDYYLEFYLLNIIVTVKIGDVINYKIMYDLEKFIVEFYNNKLNLGVSEKYENPYYDNSIIMIIKNNLNKTINFYEFCNEFISSYKFNIGYENIYTEELTNLTDINNNFTVSNIVKNINIVYNIDQINNNVDNYSLTNYTITTLNIYYENNVYDINSYDNYQIQKSLNYENMLMCFNKLYIKNINIFLTLIIYLLSFYEISENNIFDNVMSVINNLLLNNNFINEYLTNLKGNITSTELFNDIYGFGINARSETIIKLSNMVNTYDNYKYSLITPIDYDTDNIFKNVNVVYNNGINIYKKYVNNNYNFYQWKQNYNSIYLRKEQYYNKILENNNIIINIRDNDVKIYVEMMINIFYTYISNKYYLGDGVYLDIFKKCLKIYLQYNSLVIYDGNLLECVTNYEDLSKLVVEVMNNKITNLDELKYLMFSIYYYKIFEKRLIDIQKDSVEEDFLNFFKNLDIQDNYFFYYDKNLYNYINKLNILEIDEITIKKQKEELVSKKNIFMYFNLKNIENVDNERYVYYKFIQTFEIENLINLFSLSVEKLVEYDLNVSINYQLKYVYEMYFKNKIFEYKNYVVNSVQYMTYELTYKDFEYYTYEYINYIVNSFEKNLIMKRNFGITENGFDLIFINNTLKEQILFMNDYYKLSALNKKLTVKENNSLYILYVLIILLLMIKNQMGYYENMDVVLNYGNEFVVDEIKVKCLDISKSNSIFLDYINGNYIKNNVLNNYFKNIMDNTIKLNIQYFVFDNKTKYQNELIKNKFVELIKNFVVSESEMTLDLLPNVLTNLINEKNKKLIKYNKKENINTIIQEIIDALNNNFEVLINVFGGLKENIGSEFAVPTSVLNTYYNENVMIVNEEYYTIFTLIYSNFKNFEFDNINLFVLPIYFYFMLMIIYVSVYGNKFVINLNLVVKYLVSIIAEKIKNNDLEFINKLNFIFIKQNSNSDLIKLSKIFFDELLFNKGFVNEEIILKSNSILENNSNSNVSVDSVVYLKYFENMVENKYVYNSKLSSWNNMLVNIIDFNKSEVMNNLKSISIDNIKFLNVPKMFVDYINKKIPLNAKYGILNIMNKIELLIGSQLIDHFNQESYEIIYNMTNVNKIDTVSQFYGIGLNNDNFVDTELAYIKKMVNKFYYIPLYFFIKDRFNPLPLIACIYPVIQFKLHTNTNTIINNYYKTNVINKKKPLYKLSALYDYIFLEREERKLICNRINDNLIEKHNYFVLSRSINDFNKSFNNDLITIMFEFELENSVKELFWLLDLYINDYSLPNIVNSNSENGFVLSTLFYIDGIRINGIQPFVSFTTKEQATLNNDDVIQYGQFDIVNRYLNTYKYNTRSDPSFPYYSYSFAICPESFQPTGTFNMSNIKKFGIQIIINKSKLLKYIQGYGNLDKLAINMKLFTSEYNIVRYQSGLAGLLFSK